MTAKTRPGFGLPLRVDAVGIRSVLLASAIFVYAVAGSPTPDNLSAVEIFVGLLLVLASAGFLFRSADESAPPWQIRAQMLLVYGLSVPVVAAFAAGAAPNAVLRDVIPFLFMLLPLFVQSPARDDAVRLLCTALVAGAGVIFAARAAAYPLGYWLAGHKPAMADPLYLANAPTVLFSALLLLGLAGRQLYEGAASRRLVAASFLAAVSVVPLAAMILAKQRASFVAVLIYVGALLAAAVIRRPGRAMLPLLAVFAAALAAGDIGLKIYHVMALKTEMVGANMRWQEAGAVLDRLGGNVFAALFGKGWGAQVASPAVGGETVNFTHSLLTSYWLKTGLAGLALVLAYLYELGLVLLRVLRQYPVVGMAIALPLIIDIFLYASFKSLDFGLILLLVTLWAPEVASERQKI